MNDDSVQLALMTDVLFGPGVRDMTTASSGVTALAEAGFAGEHHRSVRAGLSGLRQVG